MRRDYGIDSHLLNFLELVVKILKNYLDYSTLSLMTNITQITNSEYNYNFLIFFQLFEISIPKTNLSIKYRNFFSLSQKQLL